MADLDRLAAILNHFADPWSRELPIHLTASALIVHPASGQALLRWHHGQQAWLQLGGHADRGETDPIEIVLREGREETGLADLRGRPDPELLHVWIGAGERIADQWQELFRARRTNRLRLIVKAGPMSLSAKDHFEHSEDIRPIRPNVQIRDQIAPPSRRPADEGVAKNEDRP